MALLQDERPGRKDSQTRRERDRRASRCDREAASDGKLYDEFKLRLEARTRARQGGLGASYFLFRPDQKPIAADAIPLASLVPFPLDGRFGLGLGSILHISL